MCEADRFNEILGKSTGLHRTRNWHEVFLGFDKMSLMKLIIYVILLSLTRIAAQTDTFFVNTEGQPSSRAEAAYYRVVSGRPPEVYVREYFPNGKMHRVVECESYQPWVPDGNYIVYNKSGLRKERGQYVNGKAAGVWTWWNDDGSDSIVGDHRNGDIPFILNKGGFTEFNWKPVYFSREGKGSPTVVFLTGLGDPQFTFFNIYSRLKNKAQVFVYDRPGLGNSQVVTTPRRVDSMAVELKRLLKQQNIQPPYVFVAHSMGAFIARSYNAMQPGEMAGLVLIDPAIESQYREGLNLRPENERNAYKARYTSLLARTDAPYGWMAEARQTLDFDNDGWSTNGKIVKDLPYPNNIPFTIIASSKSDPSIPFSKQDQQLRLDYLHRLSAQNPSIKLVETANSGHYIHHDEPDLVLAEINAVLDKLRR